jgi:hypothetical protein
MAALVFVAFGMGCVLAPSSFEPETGPVTQEEPPSTFRPPTAAPPLSRAAHVAVVADAQSGLESVNADLLAQYPGAFTDGADTEAYFTDLLGALGDAVSVAGDQNPSTELAGAHEAYLAALDGLTEAVKISSYDVASAADVEEFLESSGVNAAFDELVAACEAFRDAAGPDADGAGLECNRLRR